MYPLCSPVPAMDFILELCEPEAQWGNILSLTRIELLSDTLLEQETRAKTRSLIFYKKGKLR